MRWRLGGALGTETAAPVASARDRGYAGGMQNVYLPVLLLLVSCSSSASRFGDGGADGGGAVNDGSPNFGDGGVSGGNCSSDLRSVIDANGNVLTTCAGDQGCSGGVCVPACDAAGASKGSMGCRFRVSTPPVIYSSGEIIGQPCYAVFVANAWSRNVKISASYQGKALDVTKFGRVASVGAPATWAAVPSDGVPPGKVGVLFLSHEPGSRSTAGGPLTCPVQPALSTSTSVVDVQKRLITSKGSGFAIETDAPVTAYDIMPFGGAPSYVPSAQLLLPTTAWGDNFVTSIAPATNVGSDRSEHWLHVVAATDGTEVSIVPTRALPAGTGLPAGPVNAVTKYTLNAGEFIQWYNTGDVTGSVLSASAPISVMGGNSYFGWNTKTSTLGCCLESTHLTTPPVTALGFEYVAAPIRPRGVSQESLSYRIVGAVDGTTLSYSPAVVGAPTTLARGQSAIFETTSAFTVKSQDNTHPFVFGQIIPGGMPAYLGDPEFVHVLPPAQYLSQYIFFTDPTYTDTHLVIVREKGTAGFEDVEVACAGKVSGWKAVGSAGTYEYTTLPLTVASKGVGSCTNGPQSAKSKAPFGVVVWGFSEAASYGYPAGGNAAGINQVFVPPVPH